RVGISAGTLQVSHVMLACSHVDNLVCVHVSLPTTFYMFALLDALPIFPELCSVSTQECFRQCRVRVEMPQRIQGRECPQGRPGLDRKSTRLISSHVKFSYAVFSLNNKSIILY